MEVSRCVLTGRAINKIIVGHRFIISRLDDMPYQLSGVVVFNKIDLRDDCHQIRMTDPLPIDRESTGNSTVTSQPSWLN